MVMAYLFKNTPLQTNVHRQPDVPHPDREPEVGRPERLDLEVDAVALPALPARGRHRTGCEHELDALEKRIHVLEGFEKVFDALDEIITIIRKSDGKADAAREDHEALRARRRTDRRDPRAEALSPGAARNPGHPGTSWRDVSASARSQISALLKDEAGPLGDGARRDRAVGVDRQHARRRQAPHRVHRRRRGSRVHRRRLHRRRRQRRDRLARRLGEAAEGSARPARRRACAKATRVLAVLPGSTRATVVFFTNFGTAYTSRIVGRARVHRLRRADPEAVQASSDGERVIAAFEPRSARGVGHPARRRTEDDRRRRARAWRSTSDGYSAALQPRRRSSKPSTRAGRRFARPPDGAEVVGVARGRTASETLIAVTRQARALLCKVDRGELPVGPRPRRDPDQAAIRR